MTLLWWKMNFISCHIQNSSLLCGRSESGKRDSLSSFGSWSEWVQEWVEIHLSGNPVAVTQISIQTCAHRQACTNARRHGSLHLNCPLQGNSAVPSAGKKKKKTNLCAAEYRETFAGERFLMSLSQGGQRRPCRAALCWIRLDPEHSSHQAGSDQSPGWRNALRDEKINLINVKTLDKKTPLRVEKNMLAHLKPVTDHRVAWFTDPGSRFFQIST